MPGVVLVVRGQYRSMCFLLETRPGELHESHAIQSLGLNFARFFDTRGSATSVAVLVFLHHPSLFLSGWRGARVGTGERHFRAPRFLPRLASLLSPDLENLLSFDSLSSSVTPWPSWMSSSRFVLCILCSAWGMQRTLRKHVNLPTPGSNARWIRFCAIRDGM